MFPSPRRSTLVVAHIFKPPRQSHHCYRTPATNASIFLSLSLLTLSFFHPFSDNENIDAGLNSAAVMFVFFFFCRYEKMISFVSDLRKEPVYYQTWERETHCRFLRRCGVCGVGFCVAVVLLIFLWFCCHVCYGGAVVVCSWWDNTIYLCWWVG